MTLGMLGPMKQQADHRRREPRATNLTRRRECRLVSLSKLIERALDCCLERRHQFTGGHLRVGRRFPRENPTLAVRERLTARIREQAIETADRVEHMKPDRRRLRMHLPDTCGCQAVKNVCDLLARLEQAMSNRLKVRRHASNRTSQPDLRLGHMGIVWRTPLPPRRTGDFEYPSTHRTQLPTTETA